MNYVLNHNDINKIILFSPVDMVCRFKSRVKDEYDNVIEQAKKLVLENKPYEMLTSEYSALKISTTMGMNTPSDILKLEEERCDNSILDYNGCVSVIVGTSDHCSKDFGMEYLKEKLTKRFEKAKFNFDTIENADHMFKEYEQELANKIAEKIVEMNN